MSKTISIKRSNPSLALMAGALLLGFAGIAHAGEAGPRLVNSNGTLEVVYDGAAGTEVGGAHARISGAGANLAYQAAPNGRTQADSHLTAVASNVNGTLETRYVPTQAASAPIYAGLAKPGPAQN